MEQMGRDGGRMGSNKVKMVCVWEGKLWNKWEGMEEGWEARRLRCCAVCGRGRCGTNGKGWREDRKQVKNRLNSRKKLNK